MELTEIMEQLKDSLLGKHMEFMHDMYNELEEAQVRFCSDFDLHCKDDCCECCKHFQPDVTDLEAQYLALGLISEGREQEILDLLKSQPEYPDRCPLCDPVPGHPHCMIYRWRPLLCRLFGAAVTRDKEGAAAFRNCRWNEHTHAISSAELSGSDDVVYMSDYGMRLEEEDIDNTETRLLAEALPPAVEKVRLILSYEE